MAGMAGDLGKPDPSRTFMQGMVDISDYLLHHYGHGVELVGKMGAAEVFAVGEVFLHFGAAADAAWKSDWEKVAEHCGSMGNAGASFLTGGALGVIEGTVDAAVLLHHMQGHNAITFDQAMNLGFKTMGEHLGDKIADAREVAQLWVDKILHGDHKADQANPAHPGAHLYEKIDIRQALLDLKVDLNRLHDDKKQHEPQLGHGGHAGHHAHSGHKDGMSVPDHVAHPAGHGSDVNTMNITLLDQAHYNAAHAGTQSHQGGMSVPDHVAHPAGQGSDTTTMNITPHDVAHFNATHAGAQGQQSRAMNLPLDTPTHQGGQAPHQGGMSVPDHVAHPAGQGSETIAMRLHDLTHHNAGHAGGQGQQSSAMNLPLDTHPHQGGMSVPDHVAHPAGQGSETTAMNITLHDQAHHNAAHAMVHDPHDVGHGHS